MEYKLKVYAVKSSIASADLIDYNTPATAGDEPFLETTFTYLIYSTRDEF